jgi:hypothetical protein
MLLIGKTAIPRPKRTKRTSTVSGLALLVVTGATFFAPVPAYAQEATAENKAAARDLATEGIQLAQGGKCEEAIPKLSRADKLFHAPTIVTWIGQCQIEVGRYVEGTETLNRVVREQINADAPEAFHTAQQKARDLIAQAQPKIAKLTIEVTPADIEGLSVTVDERPMSSALVGAGKPTDPGIHKVTVSAPGYRSITKEIELDEGGLESLSFELKQTAGAASAAPTDESAEATKPEEAKTSPNWLGFTAVGVGAALMAGGGVLGYLAMNKEGQLNCDDDGTCPPSEDGTLTSARTNAMVSTILFGVGAAVSVTGVVLLLTSGPKKSEIARGRYVEPRVGIGRVGLSGAV